MLAYHSPSTIAAVTRDRNARTCKDAAVKLSVIGCSPAWPNPGGAQSGYLVESGQSLLLDCGPGVLSRLREQTGAWPESWPEPDSIAITHFHLDHWGDLVPWVWGWIHANGLGGNHDRPELWVPPNGKKRLEGFGSELGFPDMFERVFRIFEYAPGVPFTTAGHTITAARMPHYTVEAYGFRVTANGQTLAYSADSAPGEHLSDLARDADLFVCEATLSTGDRDGEPRGHLSLDEAEEAFEASGARRLLITHRPSELNTPTHFELAADGLVLEIQ
jgi:ribonuclease BN (tRNA processing enzyme)